MVCCKTTYKIKQCNLPVTITTPGKYTLCSDLYWKKDVAAITIDSDCVTLDLECHSIDLKNSGLGGVLVKPHTNVVVTGGTIKNAKAFGVAFEGSEGNPITNSRVEETTVVGGPLGFKLNWVENSELYCVIAHSQTSPVNSTGILVENSTNITISKANVKDITGVREPVTFASNAYGVRLTNSTVVKVQDTLVQGVSAPTIPDPIDASGNVLPYEAVGYKVLGSHNVTFDGVDATNISGAIAVGFELGSVLTIFVNPAGIEAEASSNVIFNNSHASDIKSDLSNPIWESVPQAFLITEGFFGIASTGVLHKNCTAQNISSADSPSQITSNVSGFTYLVGGEGNDVGGAWFGGHNIVFEDCISQNLNITKKLLETGGSLSNAIGFGVLHIRFVLQIEMKIKPINTVFRNCVASGVTGKRNWSCLGFGVFDTDGMVLENCTSEKISASDFSGFFGVIPGSSVSGYFLQGANITLKGCLASDNYAEHHAYGYVIKGGGPIPAGSSITEWANVQQIDCHALNTVTNPESGAEVGPEGHDTACAWEIEDLTNVLVKNCTTVKTLGKDVAINFTTKETNNVTFEDVHSVNSTTNGSGDFSFGVNFYFRKCNGVIVRGCTSNTVKATNANNVVAPAGFYFHGADKVQVHDSKAVNTSAEAQAVKAVGFLYEKFGGSVGGTNSLTDNCVATNNSVGFSDLNLNNVFINNSATQNSVANYEGVGNTASLGDPVTLGVNTSIV